MTNMEMSFTLKEMDQVYIEGIEYYHSYKNAIETLKEIIEELPKYWTSEETNTYESFLELFKEKYKLLVEVSDRMNTFCERLNQKKEDLQQASVDAINSFE